MAHVPDPQYVLVVDEDARLRDALGVGLYRQGFVPLLAASGEEALDLMGGASAPVLVVLEYRLAGLPSWELLSRFRADVRWAQARVLLVSAVPRAYLPLGLAFDAFLQKPFEVSALLRLARGVMAAEPLGGVGASRSAP